MKLTCVEIIFCLKIHAAYFKRIKSNNVKHTKEHAYNVT